MVCFFVRVISPFGLMGMDSEQMLEHVNLLAEWNNDYGMGVNLDECSPWEWFGNGGGIQR